MLYQPQCSIEDINKKFGIKKGVAELVSYLSIAKNSKNTRIDEDKKICLKILDYDGQKKSIKMPQIVFVR